MNGRQPTLAAAVIALAGCSGDVTIGITDAPVDAATAVVIQFEGLDLVETDGTSRRFDFDPPERIDLLALQGGDRQLLLSEGVPEGDFTALRLRISADGSGDDSYVETPDGQLALELDAGDASGLRVERSFSVGFGDDVDLTIDFDLRRSILDPEQDGEPYRLVPHLRVVSARSAGAIFGVVDDDLVDAGCAPAIYVYEGRNRVPGDAGGANEPYNSGLVTETASGNWEYSVGALSPGDYTAALTCEADLDHPETDDGIDFAEQQNVTVSPGEATNADF